ncbi:MAG: L-histidine N(alpha)-methyltransferase [Limisphaerales bacterium]
MKHAKLLSPAISRPSSNEAFLAEALDGLSQPQKKLPCKFLYDEKGSRLFNEICELDEYYPTRTENQILRENIHEIAGSIGWGCRLVEFGSGTSAKTRHLLTHIQRISSYIPIDISGPQLLESAAQLAEEFPDVEINPLEADYTEIAQLPNTSRKPRRTVAFFPGSTIGNFEPAAATAFLRNIALLCARDGGLLIGIDRKKEKRTLEAAYNDRKGITAAFNLNILERANRELGADFDLSSFRHRAPYNETHGRIEMHLVSTRPQIAHLGSQEFSFERGEYITTEYSYKYAVTDFAGLALRAGFRLVKSWEDPDRLFSVLFLRVGTVPTEIEKKLIGSDRELQEACAIS